jgi:bacterioferritin-associated ferredoxin
MYVCVCKAVTEKQIFKAAQAGAKHVKDLKESLGVASECGRCADCAKNCLREAHAELSMPYAMPKKSINIAVQLA